MVPDIAHRVTFALADFFQLTGLSELLEQVAFAVASEVYFPLSCRDTPTLFADCPLARRQV